MPRLDRGWASGGGVGLAPGDIVTPYVRYLAGRSSPTLELRRASEGGMFDRYIRHFDSAWNRARDWTQ